jgi:hypothetical protein
MAARDADPDRAGMARPGNPPRPQYITHITTIHRSTSGEQVQDAAVSAGRAAALRGREICM